MTKLVLNDLTSLVSTGIINSNNTAIEQAIENTLSLDGTVPNSMNASLDMNSNRVINLADGVNAQDAATKAQLDSVIASGLPVQTGANNKALHSDGALASWQAVDGTNVINTPAGNIAAVDVQAAINELDTEKATDTSVVHITSTESVTGQKTFTSPLATADATAALGLTTKQQVVEKTSATGSAIIPNGTTAQRDGTPAVGYQRWNTTLAAMEVWDGAAWSALGGGGGYTWDFLTFADPVHTLADNEARGCDTSGGAFNINLPAVGVVGQKVMITDGLEAGSWGTNNVTIVRDRTTDTIDGVMADYVLDVNNGWVELIDNGTGWVVRTDFTGSSNQTSAWVRFSPSTGAILASHNVSSVTRIGAGDYEVFFSTNMSHANYAVGITAQYNSIGTGAFFNQTAGLFVGSCKVQHFESSLKADPTSISVTFTGGN